MIKKEENETEQQTMKNMHEIVDNNRETTNGRISFQLLITQCKLSAEQVRTSHMFFSNQSTILTLHY